MGFYFLFFNKARYYIVCPFKQGKPLVSKLYNIVDKLCRAVSVTHLFRIIMAHPPLYQMVINLRDQVSRVGGFFFSVADSRDCFNLV